MSNIKEFRARFVEDVSSSGINNGVAKKVKECKGEDLKVASFRKLKRCDNIKA